MKRLLSLSVLLMLALLSFAHDFEVKNADGVTIYYNITSSSDLTVAVTYKGTSYSQYSNEYTGSVTIPEKVTYIGKTYSVTSIGSRAFYDCSGLKSVTIPNSVTSIGESAFYSCSSLTSITIPNSVTSIDSSAFWNCRSLTSVTINSNSIISKEYSSTFNLSNILGSQVKSYIIGDGVTAIGDYAFFKCSGLTSVTIPNSVTSIGDYAFSVCSGLTSVEIPNSVTSIGDYAFFKCSGLISVTIPNSVTSIGKSAFYNCSGLTSITIPNSVMSIGYDAFSYCTGLTSITIPNSVTSIGDYAFLYCSGLKKVIVPDIAAWCNISFGNYAANPLYYAKHIFSDENTEIKDLVIPNSVTSIGESAFSNCSSLTSVTIGNSVTSIGSDVFYGCNGLINVNINSNSIISKTYSSESNLKNIFGSQVKSYIIGDGVTAIGESAFSNCSSLTSVTIPNSVTSIGESAFSGCSSLTSVTINSNSIISKEYSSTFNLSNIFGSQVKSYIIGDDVTAIGNNAFYGCSGLTSVTIGNSVTSIGDWTFYNCSGLTKVIVPDIAAWCNIDFGDNPLYYAKHIYSDENTEITDLVIPNSVTTIGSSAFYKCSGLTSVTIPNSVTSIGGYAFYGCI